MIDVVATPASRRRLARLDVALALTVLGLVPAAVLLLCSVSADLVAMVGGDPFGIWTVLPAGPVAGDWVSAELASTSFMLVGIALARRKRTGFWLALAMMAGALVVQGARLDHPLAAASAILVAVILLATRRRYQVGTGRRDTRLAVGLVAAGVALAVLGAVATSSGFDAFGAIADAVGSVFDIATPVAVPGLAAVAALLLVARLGYLLATILTLEAVHDDRPVAEIAAARRTLRRVGAGSLFPYQLAPGVDAFADAEGTAVVASASIGRCAVALGDAAGDPDAAGRVLAGWADRCRQRDVVPVVYQASGARATQLHEAGWRSCPVGREAFVDPATFDLGSPRVANLRHTITRSRKGGIRTIWSPTGVAGFTDPRLAGAMGRLDAEWRRTAGPQMGFTVGRFDPQETGDTAVAVALDPAGDPVAFVVLRPTGSDGGWMLDVMRRARGGVPGAVEACFATAIEALGEMGVRRLSLGLAPLSGLDRSSALLAERLLARGARLARPFYDHEGLAFFKGKFAPTWEPRYLAVPGWVSLGTAVVTLLRLHLGGSWPNVVRSVAAGLVPAR